MNGAAISIAVILWAFPSRYNHPGFFDWVELLGTLDPDADAGPALHAGPYDLDMPELSRSRPGLGLEIPSVEIRKR